VAAAPATTGPADDAKHPGAVLSPMVGVAYLSSEPGAAPFVSVGQTVAAGQTLLLIEAMKKADSAEPAKYLPVLEKIEFSGATGRIAFDEKGDRKDAEITIFTMKEGKLAPIAVVKGGQSMKFEDFIAQAAAPAAPAAPAAAPAAEAPKADAPKKDAGKQADKKKAGATKAAPEKSFIDEFTSSTYIMVIVSGADIE